MIVNPAFLVIISKKGLSNLFSKQFDAKAKQVYLCFIVSVKDNLKKVQDKNV